MTRRMNWERARRESREQRAAVRESRSKIVPRDRGAWEDWRLWTLRYPTKCERCNESIPAGTEVYARFNTRGGDHRFQHRHHGRPGGAPVVTESEAQALPTLITRFHRVRLDADMEHGALLARVTAAEAALEKVRRAAERAPPAR